MIYILNMYVWVGSCIPNLGCFKQKTTSPKLRNRKNPFTKREITSLDICHPYRSVRIPVKGGSLFYQVHQFLALLLNLGHFGHFVPAST